jgi:hypothetical protein
MSEFKPLSALLKMRRPVNEVLAGILDENPSVSKDAGERLVNAASSYGLGMRDYLTLAIDVDRDANFKNSGLNGYEASLVHLNLPIRNDFKEGIVLEAAGNTFQTYQGSRALFPEVVDDMLKWINRQNSIEQVAPMLAQSRTINGIEMINTFVNDDSNDRKTFTVAELGRIPIRTLTTSQQSVAMYKHGSGYRTSYEFQRRVRMDVLVPFANRVSRELEVSKVIQATNMLINGDATGLSSAAPVVTQSSFTGAVAATNGILNYERMLRWLTSRAKPGVGAPVDTVIGNYKAWVDWILLFQPTLPANSAPAAGAAAGAPTLLPNTTNELKNPVSFVLSSGVPDNQLIGISKGETLEELVEAGSLISESANSIQNQSITYVRSENTGYKLAFYDTRSIYNYGA